MKEITEKCLERFDTSIFDEKNLLKRVGISQSKGCQCSEQVKAD